MDPLSQILGFFSWLSTLGYIGMFILAALTSILPTPFHILLFFSGAVLNPLLLGIICGIGAAIGELLVYHIGLGIKKAALKKHEKNLEKARHYFQRYGGFLVLIAFTSIPFPDDIVGIFAGLVHYPKKKFFIAVLIGKLIMCLYIAYAGFFSATWVLALFGIT